VWCFDADEAGYSFFALQNRRDGDRSFAGSIKPLIETTLLGIIIIFFLKNIVYYHWFRVLGR
jgi:hypothetical protein